MIYVASTVDNTISVIDGDNNTKIGNDIPVGKYPIAIGVYAYLNIANTIYVANYDDGTVSVINGYNNTKIGNDTKVGKKPFNMGINWNTGRIYVANQDDSPISVIDGKTNTKISNDIPVGKNPAAIGVNIRTNTIYVAIQDDNSISVIDGESNKVVARVMFNVEPFNSGHVECEKVKSVTPLLQYFYLYDRTKCIAKPNKGFEFVSWQKNFNGNHTIPIKVSTSTPTTIYDYIANSLDSIANFLGIKPLLISTIELIDNKTNLQIKSHLDNLSKFFGVGAYEDGATLNITQFGSFTANFRALPAPLPPEFLTTIFSFAITTVLGSWLIPPFIRWIKSRADIRNLTSYHKKISFII